MEISSVGVRMHAPGTARLSGLEEEVGETLPKPIPPTPIHGEDVQRERGEVSA